MRELEIKLHGPPDALASLSRALRAHGAKRSRLQATPIAALSERHATHVTRLRCHVHDALGSDIEVTLDIGTPSVAASPAPIAELGLRHHGGPLQGLFDLAAAWIRHGGLWICTVHGPDRGERVRKQQAHSPAVKAPSPRLDHDADGPTLMRLFLRSALEQVLAHAGGVAEGSSDAETIHQVRVGLRRLRTVLREGAALSPAIAPSWDAVLARAFAQLGQRRDEEVVAAAVRPLLEAASAPRLSWQARGSADPALVVREASFQTTLVAVLALAHAGAERFAPLSPAAARELLAKRLRNLHRKVVLPGRRFERLPLAEQHRVRKRLKRLRYLAELAAGLYPRDAVHSDLRRLGAAQDALGRHNDVAVAAAAFRADAREHASAWFAAGYLQAHLAVTGRAARKALTRIVDAKHFWD